MDPVVDVWASLGLGLAWPERSVAADMSPHLGSNSSYFPPGPPDSSFSFHLLLSHTCFLFLSSFVSHSQSFVIWQFLAFAIFLPTVFIVCRLWAESVGGRDSQRARTDEINCGDFSFQEGFKVCQWHWKRNGSPCGGREQGWSQNTQLDMSLRPAWLKKKNKKNTNQVPGTPSV